MGEGLANFPLFVYNNDNLGIFKTGKDKGEKMKAFLILEDGHVFTGRSIGSTREAVSEIVFNTSMTGYLEVLTDPSYAGQAVVMTYPLIGNYGICYEDMESERPWVDGFIVRELSRMPSNFRCEDTIQNFLEKNDIPGICGIDTRALTKILRESGTMNGMITTNENYDMDEVMKKIREINRRNEMLKKKYKQDERFVRIHKRIREANAERQDRPIISAEEYEIAENLSKMKQDIDHRLFLNIHMLDNEESFKQDVLAIIGQELRNMNIRADLKDRKYINNLITSEYLQQYNNP